MTATASSGTENTAQAIPVNEKTTAANQGGLLTPEQQQRLGRAVRAETSPGLTGAAMMIALFLVLLLASLNTPEVAPVGYLVFGGLLLLSALLMGALFRRRALLLAEVQAGQLEQATGPVEWKSGRYRAQVPGRTLDLTAFNLAAGSYHFGYLPRSGRVVSAQLAAADTPAQALDELRHVLAVANHFNLDDLPAYREGKQGPGTFRRLRQQWATAIWLGLAAFGLALLFTFMVVTEAGQDFAPIVIFIAVFLLLGAVGGTLGDIRPTLDILGGQVLARRGEVGKFKRETHGRYATTFYYYTLNGQDWLVSPDAYRALIAGQRYRLYYLPRSKKLVGIEPAD
jgi:hypothetical protein